MNFIAKSTGIQGFHGEEQNQKIIRGTPIGGNLPFSSSSYSNSSNQQQQNLAPPDFHHHNHRRTASWLENKFELSQEEMTSLRCYSGGNDDGDDDANISAAVNDENDVRRGDLSSDGLGLAVGGGGGGEIGSSTVGLAVVEREHMFDKVVTPSDVGKLNRLVIPKQHAERYFPLDSSTNEKGLLLNFEDRNGKPWRFRYSYWNSSQSYVMTKGWSRFVKEKKLDAGDIVSFQRGVGELGRDRLFIDWRRRPDAPVLAPPLSSFSHLPPHYLSFQRSTHPWSPLFLQPQARAASRDHSHFSMPINSTTSYGSGSAYGYGYNSVVNPCSSSVIYLRSAGPQQPGMVRMPSGGDGGGGGVEPVVFESVPVVQGKAAAKRLRLFGVNMDCPISESEGSDILPSTTTSDPTMAPHSLYLSSSPLPPPQLRLYNGSPMPAMQSDYKAKASDKSSFH